MRPSASIAAVRGLHADGVDVKADSYIRYLLLLPQFAARPAVTKPTAGQCRRMSRRSPRRTVGHDILVAEVFSRQG